MNLVQTIQGVHLLELADQVGDHPAGDLVGQDARVDQGELVRREVLLVLGGDLLEMFAQLDAACAHPCPCRASSPAG